MCFFLIIDFFKYWAYQIWKCIFFCWSLFKRINKLTKRRYRLILCINSTIHTFWHIDFAFLYHAFGTFLSPLCLSSLFTMRLRFVLCYSQLQHYTKSIALNNVQTLQPITALQALTKMVVIWIFSLWITLILTWFKLFCRGDDRLTKAMASQQL